MSAHNSSAYRKARLDLKALQIPTCHLCSGARGPIRYDLDAPDPLSFSADHWPPVSTAGEHTNLLPVHLVCQHEQGGRIRTGQDTMITAPTSGVWS